MLPRYLHFICLLLCRIFLLSILLQTSFASPAPIPDPNPIPSLPSSSTWSNALSKFQGSKTKGKAKASPKSRESSYQRSGSTSASVPGDSETNIEGSPHLVERLLDTLETNMRELSSAAQEFGKSTEALVGLVQHHLIDGEEVSTHEALLGLIYDTAEKTSAMADFDLIGAMTDLRALGRLDNETAAVVIGVYSLLHESFFGGASQFLGVAPAIIDHYGEQGRNAIALAVVNVHWALTIVTDYTFEMTYSVGNLPDFYSNQATQIMQTYVANYWQIIGGMTRLVDLPGAVARNTDDLVSNQPNVIFIDLERRIIHAKTFRGAVNGIIKGMHGSFYSLAGLHFKYAIPQTYSPSVSLFKNLDVLDEVQGRAALDLLKQLQLESLGGFQGYIARYAWVKELNDFLVQHGIYSLTDPIPTKTYFDAVIALLPASYVAEATALRDEIVLLLTQAQQLFS